MINTQVGIIYIKSNNREQIISSFLKFYEGIGYVQFDSFLPENYPAEREEFKEFLISKNSLKGYFISFIEEFERIFEVAYGISKILKNNTVLALRKFSVQEALIKVYKGNDVLLKFGTDEDHELSYYPPPLNEISINNTLNAVGIMERDSLTKVDEILKSIEKGKQINIQTFIYLFNLPDTEIDINSIKNKKQPENYEYFLLINKRSALYINL